MDAALTGFAEGMSGMQNFQIKTRRDMSTPVPGHVNVASILSERLNAGPHIYLPITGNAKGVVNAIVSASEPLQISWHSKGIFAL